MKYLTIWRIAGVAAVLDAFMHQHPWMHRLTGWRVCDWAESRCTGFPYRTLREERWRENRS